MQIFPGSATRRAPSGYVITLLFLLAGFTGRSLAQFCQWIRPVDWLPPFEAWQSGLLSYPVLAGCQLGIIAACARVTWRLQRGRLRPNARWGLVLLGLGAVYFFFMALRLWAGLTFAAGHPWWDAPLQAVFHMVLALFLLVLGLHHYGRPLRVVALATYPLGLLAVILAHRILVALDVSLLVATLGPLLAMGVLITLLEHRFPERRHWRPNRHDVLNDTLFMLVVQQLVPRLLGVGVIVVLAQSSQAMDLFKPGPWPHHWPVVGQMLLMMVLVDIVRYGLHRAAHSWSPLWRLHAVHHSPHKLYWLNVGRFHPLEKALQYLLDTLPFLLLGVSEQVLALYLVLFATNGFFKHSNVRLRLGWLNHVVSGPELHRWHHSERVEESNNNYGNNLIIWDTLFGTRFHPDARRVGRLGLVNRAYPTGFGAQMKAPFVAGLDRTDGEGRS